MPDTMELRAQTIVGDALESLNREKGHSLCTETCTCSVAIRLAEDHLRRALETLRNATGVEPLALPETDVPEKKPATKAAKKAGAKSGAGGTAPKGES